MLHHRVLPCCWWWWQEAEARVTTRDAVRCVALAHVGPYSDMGTAWRKLYPLAMQHKIPRQGGLTIMFDDMKVIPSEALRAVAAFVVPDDYVLPPELVAEGLHIYNLRGGDFAAATLTGA